MDPEMHPSQEARAILDLFDGEISIFEKEGEKGGGKYLKINKMSNQRYLEDEVPLKREELEIKPQESKTGQTVLDKYRIAVLPFVSMSPDPNDEYFADGMTEEIISTVSGISGLRVISRTSVMSYKGTAKKLKEIGRELEVGSVLEGSFRKAGNRIRVTTQLINVADDEHLWAQNYDRNLDDLFEVQSDIAKQVADALRVKILSPEKERIEKKPTESTTAYSLYLKGRYFWSKRGVESTRRALEYFELAAKEDPGFALGYVGRADCCLTLRSWNIDFDKNQEVAKAMVAKALELDPELAEAHATMGMVAQSEYDLRQAEKEYRKAIELKPSYATAHERYFILLAAQLRWDEALEQIERAMELDPLSPATNLDYGNYHACRRDYARAIEPFKKAAELGYYNAQWALGSAYGRMEMYDDMRREFATLSNIVQDAVPVGRLRIDVQTAYLENDKQTLRRLLPELETHYQDIGQSACACACYRFFLGEKDKGFEWLERAYSRREDDLVYVKLIEDLDSIRDDPRYLDILKRLGLDQTARPTS
jgi:TolB-like protein